MGFHWDVVVQGAVTGLVGAGMLALLVLCRNQVRDWLLKRFIRRHLKKMSVGSSLEGVTTSIHNQTGREMTIRQVAFLMDGTYMVLLPSGELTSSYKGQTRKPTRAEMRRLKKGEMIQMEAQMQFRSWRVPPTAAGFVELPPYAKTSFILPAQYLADSDSSVASIRVVLEYTTRTAEKKLLQHDVKPQYPDHIKMTLDRFREELRSGSLNKVRRMLQMTEIAVKPKPVGESAASTKG